MVVRDDDYDDNDDDDDDDDGDDGDDGDDSQEPHWHSSYSWKKCTIISLEIPWRRNPPDSGDCNAGTEEIYRGHRVPKLHVHTYTYIHIH